MTLANKITIARFLLIPVFVVFAIYYSDSLLQGQEHILYRQIALAVFVVAMLSDALDGYIARHYHQSTALGRALDPVADKLLLLASILTLGIAHWNLSLPLWFAVLVVARDVMIISGVLIIHYTVGSVRMGPLISSKICTFLQLSCVCWILVDFWSVRRPLVLETLIGLAALFTVVSGIQYLREGIQQLREAGHTHPDS